MLIGVYLDLSVQHLQIVCDEAKHDKIWMKLKYMS